MAFGDPARAARIEKPAIGLWLVLLLDALVVGVLACTMAGSSYVAARNAAARKKVKLSI